MDNPRIDEHGTKEWYVNGERHRSDGPAIEWWDNDTEWWLHGERHRSDGPAIVYANDRKSWYLNDDRHRTDGPAIEWANGQMDWYLNDHIYSFDDWLDANTDLTDGEKVMMKLQYG
jgi:hypothetical protein